MALMLGIGKHVVNKGGVGISAVKRFLCFTLWPQIADPPFINNGVSVGL